MQSSIHHHLQVWEYSEEPVCKTVSNAAGQGRAGQESELATEAYTEAEQAALVISARWSQVQPHVLHLPHSQLVNGDGHSAYFIILVQGMVLQQDSCQLLMLWLMHKQLKVLLPPAFNRRDRWYSSFLMLKRPIQISSQDWKCKLTNTWGH